MFIQEVRGLTLTSAVADTLFQNITGTHFGFDESFLATLRALVYDRIQKEESVTLKFSNLTIRKNDCENTTARDLVRYILRRSGILDGDTGVLCVYSLDGNDEDAKATLAVIDKNGLTPAIGGFKSIEKIAQYFSQKCRFDARVYVNEDTRNTVVLVNHVTLKRWHCIQGMIPLYLPWFFNDKPISEKEQALLLTLQKRYEPEYRKLIEEIAQKFDFRTEALKQQLKGFETEFEREKIETVDRQINMELDNIERIRRNFQQHYQTLQELQIQKIGLETAARNGGGEESNETLDFFLHNKALELVERNKGRLKFIVKTTINNYDPDLFDRAIRNKRSFFYIDYWSHRPYPGNWTPDMIERLMTAIFSDEKLKLRVCAAYYVDFREGSYGGFKEYDYPRNIRLTYMPNQHIDKYRCLGNNEQYIWEAMRKHDFVTAIMQCLSSAQNINFSEDNTGTFFMQVITSKDPGCIIELPNGEAVTPIDAVKWLEDQDEKKPEVQEAKREAEENE